MKCDTHTIVTGFFGEMGPYAQLYGASSMVFSAGFTIGPLVGGFLKQQLGYGNMNAVLAVCCALAATCSFTFLGGKPKLRFWEKSSCVNSIT